MVQSRDRETPETKDQPLTIEGLIRAKARRAPLSQAFVAMDHLALTYAGLLAQVEHVHIQLNRAGLGFNDPVALVLPPGLEMACAIVAICCTAPCAPLNPSYQVDEFQFYLSDLRAKAVVVCKEMDSAVSAAARKLGIPIFELHPLREMGTAFSIAPQIADTVSPKLAQPNDVALLLHTSGTTSRPKLVPLTQANVCTSAHNICRFLHLTLTDRCVNPMPLFHIHGIVAGILSSLASGGSVVCMPQFTSTTFFRCFKTFWPTWYTAVPAIHQSILTEAPLYNQMSSPNPHCGSFVLHPHRFRGRVLQELEQVFAVPVIESYGMTEAAHQICSNPLPPSQLKPGSVGLPAGPDVAIMNEGGQLLGANTPGEIVIRGASVMGGYANNQTANAVAFTNDWLRTGDLGHVDQDGYFFLTGRIKEIINRGGEKVSPREIDEVLGNHPAVAQALTFPVPHARLGEDVAVAIVLRSGASATEGEIRDFVFDRLAAAKVPSRVVFVKELPKGPSGKPQRIGLADKLAILLKPTFVPPSSPVEHILARIWREVLGVAQPGIEDNFFNLGGDSLLATAAATRINAAFPVSLPTTTIFRLPKIADLANAIEENLLAQVEARPD